MHAVNGATEGRRSGHHCRKYGKVAAYRFQRLMKALAWPVATYGCESWTLRKNEETRLDAFGMKGLRKIQRVSWTAKITNEWLLNKAGVEGTVRHHQSKEASILWSHNEETREFPGERDTARNNARCTQARKATHGLDGQHQDVDRALRGRVIRYDTRCYFNVRSKADISQLNLPHGTDN